jgi:DNA processing protein
MEDTPYWIAFHRIPGIGPARFARLLEHFGSLRAAWAAGADELTRCGLDTKCVESIVMARRSISPEAEHERVWQLGVSVLTWESPEYPTLLREIPASPPVLYVKGSLMPEDGWAVAVVGTRRASAYGREVAERLSGALAAGGVTVVSGLARGIDTHAHRAALAAGGRTIAVLGSGIDVVYPAENAALAAEIVEHGALLSELPLGSQPAAENFPLRNRIISGLSLGTVLVEAPLDSGARITCSYALEQNREVFAVPGNIFSRNAALPHRLIQEGAKLVTCAEDILAELNLSMAPQQQEVARAVPATLEEAAILNALAGEPQHVDEIGRACGLPAATVSALLTMMELKGLVKHLGGMIYAAAR